MYKRKSTFNERDVIFLYEYGRRAMIERERRINKLKQKMREREGKPGDEYCAIYNRAIRHRVEIRHAMQRFCPHTCVLNTCFYFFYRNKNHKQDIYVLRMLSQRIVI